MRTITIGLLLLAGAAVAQDPKPPELTPEEQKLAAEAKKLNAEAVQLNTQGKPLEAVAKMQRSLELFQQIYPVSKYPDGHRDVANCLSNTAYMLLEAGSAEKALLFYEQSLAMSRKLYPLSKHPDGHLAILISLNNTASALHAAGAAEKALPFSEQALAMCQKLFPQSKYPNGHPFVAGSLQNLGFVLQAAGSVDKALPLLEQALPMYHRLYPASKYPNGHPDLVSCLNNMGSVLHTAGSTEKALPFFEQALAMRRKLYPASKYPDGHSDLAQGLSNMGFVLQAAGSPEKALPFFEQALEMCRQLYPQSKYPDGHPYLAQCINNVGTTLQAVGSPDKALPYCEEALAMKRRLYPASKFRNGHPELAQGLNNLAMVLQAGGSVEKALPIAEEGLAMRRQLFPVSKYPDGHLDLTRSLNNVGFLLQAAGSADKALPVFEQALAMLRTLGQRQLLTSSEEGALGYLQGQPLTRDLFLSAALHQPGAGAAEYRAVWQTKAAVARILELRHAAARRATSSVAPAAADGLIRLKENRRRTERVLQDPRHQPADRDKELARLADERDAIERQLAKDLPILALWKERDQRTPDDLAKALPAGAAFIDLLAWTHSEHDPKAKVGQKHIPSYLAFVVAPGPKVERIDLGPAAPINAAILAWRRAIERGDMSDGSERVTALLWDKIARHLPAGTRTLYLAADGDLARLPWAALPTRKDRVLLEDYVLAMVPHGPFLLEQLQHSPPARAALENETVLALGDVSYNSPIWPALPGTRHEVAGLAALAPNSPVALTKTEATAAKLTEMLPKARYAHLATHGEFQAEAFAAEQQRLLAARRDWEEGKTQEARRVAAKNPLAYVGLVLANGERLSGLSILDLDLANLKLVTLSACETGLGEFTGGKGVENLQLAFHLAGAENVVASLWKVDDAATAALMAKFYHELWVAKKPPIEALREAQLTIYHHPELIPDLAGERGAPKLKEAVETKAPAKPQAATHASTKLWAAFVLSGAGK